MNWTIEYAASAAKSIRKLDARVQGRIRDFLETRVARADDPRALAAPLKGAQFGDLWRFRVGDYRIIAEIEGDRIRVLVLRVGHRRDIYR